MQSFDDSIKKTIEEIVRNVFEDEATARAIFQYLTETRSKGLGESVQFFADSLPKILGSGSVIIEDLILETLYSRYGLDIAWKKDCKFADYIMELRKRSSEVVLNEVQLG